LEIDRARQQATPRPESAAQNQRQRHDHDFASGFPKIATADAAGATFAPQASRAAGKTVTILHESSFIPPFDEFINVGCAYGMAIRRTGIY